MAPQFQLLLRVRWLSAPNRIHQADAKYLRMFHPHSAGFVQVHIISRKVNYFCTFELSLRSVTSTTHVSQPRF